MAAPYSSDKLSQINSKQPSIVIVILNYNGASLLPQCLPSITAAAKKSRYPVKVTLLDNLSKDDGLDYARKNFPEVEIVICPNNLYLCSYNDYLRSISEDIAILLNNDIRVEEDFIDPLIEKFLTDPKTFLVAPMVKDFSGTQIESGRCVAKVRWGIFWSSGRYPGFENEAHQASETYSSGFGAFNRKIFCELGGYDERYLPGIFEDVDLCYRAQQRGYHLFYEPKSVVYHMGQASFKKAFGSDKIARLAHRNNFIFMWKNFRSPLFWVQHIVLLPFRLAFALVRGNVAFVKGFFDALGHKQGNQI